MTQVRVVIHGRVQGVWFRGWTVDEARSRGLKGWVRNRSDGTVEAIFDGPEEAVAAVLEACRQGPPAARVTEMEEFLSGEAFGEGFHQRPSE